MSDASARQDGSIGRRLADLDADWVAANFTPPSNAIRHSGLWPCRISWCRDSRRRICWSSVCRCTIFSIPAKLKDWVDLAARARLTFRYTDTGPEGLLNGKRAFLLLASGGVMADSAADFASGYLRHVLGFLDINDVISHSGRTCWL